MKGYDYRIKVTELKSPQDENHFSARVAYLRELNDEEDIMVEHDFGETLGKTGAEAKEKMLQRMLAWKAKAGC